MPLFSIITITKDNLSGLIRTAESVIAQSYRNYEWVVIDGASTDGTAEYLKNFSDASIVSEPDNGLYDAMNKGMDKANGDYLIFMNAGDVFSDVDILSTIAQAIAVDNPDFIYGDALETGGFYKKARSHRRAERGMFTHHQAMVYRRTALRYDTKYRISADYDFTLRFLKAAHTVHYIPCAICLFEEGGISQRRRKEGRIEQFLIRKNMRNPIQNLTTYLLQSMSAFLRENFPKMYVRLRS